MTSASCYVFGGHVPHYVVIYSIVQKLTKWKRNIPMETTLWQFEYRMFGIRAHTVLGAFYSYSYMVELWTLTTCARTPPVSPSLVLNVAEVNEKKNFLKFNHAKNRLVGIWIMDLSCIQIMEYVWLLNGPSIEWHQKSGYKIVSYSNGGLNSGQMTRQLPAIL